MSTAVKLKEPRRRRLQFAMATLEHVNYCSNLPHARLPLEIIAGSSSRRCKSLKKSRVGFYLLHNALHRAAATIEERAIERCSRMASEWNKIKMEQSTFAQSLIKSAHNNFIQFPPTHTRTRTINYHFNCRFTAMHFMLLIDFEPHGALFCQRPRVSCDILWHTRTHTHMHATGRWQVVIKEDLWQGLAK
jgi:hypothetical protein